MTCQRLYPWLIASSIFLFACQPTTSTPLPPTETIAPSPEATSTLEPTATLPPALRTFTEDFDSPSPYWSNFGTNTVGPDIQLQSGFLVFNLTQTNDWADAIYNAQDYQDVRVDAQVEVRAGDDGTVGVVCRYSRADGWYEFNIYADQTYVIMYGQWLSPGIARYMPLHRTSSEKIKPGTNQIGLVCQGNSLTPYINNVRMIVYEDNKIGLKEGNVGLTASSFTEAPFVAAFDWVKVSEP